MPRSKRYHLSGERFAGKINTRVDDTTAEMEALQGDGYLSSVLLPSRDADAARILGEINQERARDYRIGLRRVGKP